MPEDGEAQDLGGFVDPDKSGLDLFKELFRMLPTASADDYFINGRWKREAMVLDTDIIEAHRKEAGAPEPVPVDEVELPPLPRGAASAGAAAAARPTSRPPAPWSHDAPQEGTQRSDPRQIDIFVAKHRLEPTRTKTLLARLKPEQRKWVMQSFVARRRGFKGLEDFVLRAERNSSWDQPAADAPSKPTTGGYEGASSYSLYSGGVKRPAPPASAPPVKVARTESANMKSPPALLRPTPKSALRRPSAPPRSSEEPRGSLGATRPSVKPSTSAPAKVSSDAADRPGDLIRNLLGGL